MSSKLLSAVTETEPVPWRRVAFDEEISSEEPLLFFSSDQRNGDAEPHASGAKGVYGSHKNSERDVSTQELSNAECNARIQLLEREIEQLHSQIPAEKKIAYQQGLDAGITQELNKWTESIARVSRSLADLATVKPKLRFQVEEDAVRLSLAIARKVLRRECTVDPEALAGLVRVALDKTNARDILRIRAAPQDAQDLSNRLAGMGLPSHVEVVADSGLPRGSVLLDTNQGHIDASVETQLQEIERGLADALDRNRNV